MTCIESTQGSDSLYILGPDVLPQAMFDEWTKLQDASIPFDTQIAVQQIKEEFGGPLGQFFIHI